MCTVESAPVAPSFASAQVTDPEAVVVNVKFLPLSSLIWDRGTSSWQVANSTCRSAEVGVGLKYNVPAHEYKTWLHVR